MLEKIASSPRKSVRRASSEIGVPRSTMQKVLKSEKFHPHKLQILHKLFENDSDRRLEMAVWFRGQLEEDNIICYLATRQIFMLAERSIDKTADTIRKTILILC